VSEDLAASIFTLKMKATLSYTASQPREHLVLSSGANSDVNKTRHGLEVPGSVSSKNVGSSSLLQPQQ